MLTRFPCGDPEFESRCRPLDFLYLGVSTAHCSMMNSVFCNERILLRGQPLTLKKNDL